ncbi:MAG: diguanylate cyclase domain-containing protein [Acidimicrobiales bacterium]
MTGDDTHMGSFLAEITAALPDGVVVADRVGGVLWVNPAAERLFGPSGTTMVGANALDFVHPEDRQVAGILLAPTQDDALGAPICLRIGTADGWTPVEVTAASLTPVPAAGGRVLCLRPVADRRQSADGRAGTGREGALLDNAASFTMVVDHNGVVESAAATTRLLGVAPEAIERLPLSDVVADDDRGLVWSALARALDAPRWHTGPVTIEVGMLHKSDPTPVPFLLTIVNLMDDPSVAGVIVSGHPTALSGSPSEPFVDGADTDPLTGLPNRAALCRRLERCLDDPKTAVIFLDLDGFSHVNGEFGQEAGDELLRLLGDRLRQSVRKADFVARHGGDEFVVVARTQNDRDLEKLSQRLVRAIEHPTELAGGSIRLSASAGLAHPYSDDTPDTILARADTAMSTAKIHGDGMPHAMSS